MMRVFRLQWMSVWRFELIAAGVFFLFFLMTLLCGPQSFFGVYFLSSGGIIAAVQTILGFTLGLATLNLALSLGGTRQDYYLAMQVIFFVCAVLAWVMVFAPAAVIAQMGWDTPGVGLLFSGLATPGSWKYLPVALAAMSSGTLAGMLRMSGHRVLSIICMTLSATGAYLLTLFLALGLDNLEETSLALVVTVISVILFAVMDILLYRIIRTAAVR